LFKTAGVANTAVDKDLVPESHVIGRVVWRSIIIGVVITGFEENPVPAILCFTLFFAALFIFYLIYKSLRGTQVR
jgi:hypothetical protein